MTLMIPPVIHNDVKSAAERKTFELISLDNSSPNAVCLHSLGMARHSAKRYGEIDFLFIDEWGVICFEVKGGGVRR